MAFQDSIEDSLQDLRTQGLHRDPRVVQGAQDPWVQIQGRRVLCLCANNYLGLANHPQLLEAMHRNLRIHGVGAGASRLISGTMHAHAHAEERLAEFLGLPDALLFSTGYTANVGAIQAVVGPGDLVLSDSLNHASLIDGCRLSRAKVRVYRHLDHAHLAELLDEHAPGFGRVLVVTESLFSMDGDEAPLAQLAVAAQRHGAGLMVDEAHALGVFGPSGRGLCAAHGVVPDLLVGTLGKAFGLAGAFLAAAVPTVDLVRNRARSFVFSTAPSPALAATIVDAVNLVEKADLERETLLAHAERLRVGLRDLGHHVLPGRSPIVPVIVGDSAPTMALSEGLFARGIFIHGVRPPTVPVGTGRLRAVPMASHRPADIDLALHAFGELRR